MGVFYGLDWIAAGHQIGAASAALFAGFMRTQGGSYLQPFVIVGVTGLLAAGIALTIRRRPNIATPALARR